MDGHHHLHVRKRIYKKLEEYPHPDFFKRALDKLMVFIAIVGPAAALPQVYQIYTTKSVSDLSLASWSIWLVLSIVWLLYGFIHKEIPIIISNTIYIVIHLAVVAAILAYS